MNLEEREAIVNMSKKGYSVTLIAKLMKYSPLTVKRILDAA